MILPINTIPNPILKKKSIEIKKIDEDLADLVLNMVETLHLNKGVGLAAPQIGKNIKLIVIEFDPTRYFEGDELLLKKNKAIPLTILINPKIISTSKDTTVEPESCLSCPEVEVDIPRFKSIKVLAQNLKGERIKIRAKDYFARILQHEIDHLDGILITDKVKYDKR